MKTIYIPLALSVPFLLTQCGGNSPSTGNTATVSNISTEQTAREKALASEIFTALNNYRTSQGKAAIGRSSKLDSIANAKSSLMVLNNKLISETQAPALGEAVIAQAVAAFGDRDNTAAKFINYWNSKSNSNLLLGDWSRIGVGVKINSEGLAYSTLSLKGTN